MPTWLLIVIVLATIIGIALVARRRTALRRSPDGVASFRRHMDALSSEARRDVKDRVRDAHDKRER
jgi:hypothetical protein